MNLFSKIINWYFKKDSLPYWSIFLIDCIICFFSGLFVFALFFKPTNALANLPVISRTLLFYLIFNIIGFRWFHTYAGVIRYSSFVDLKRVAYAMGVAFIGVTIIHYPIIFWPASHQWIVPLNLRHIISIYIVSTIVLWAFRIVIKMIYDTAFDNEKAKRTLIYGVKEGGVGLAKNISTQKPQLFRLKMAMTHAQRCFWPRCFLTPLEPVCTLVTFVIFPLSMFWLAFTVNKVLMS